MLGRLISSVLFAGLALAQSTTYVSQDGITFTGNTDAVHKVTHGYTLPPLGTTSNNFIGEIVAPIAEKWVGVAPGGGMLNQILIVAWPNGNSVVSSLRMASTYILPTVFTGPTLKPIRSSVNSTHWRFVYECQGCVSYDTPAGPRTLPVDSGSGAAWATSITAVDSPANAGSSFGQHNDFGFFGMIWAEAHVSQADYDRWAAGGTGPGTPGTTTTGPTPTTTTGPTPTVAPTPYDYIVVGAGPGGLVTADRLSEAGKKVLLIDRGGPSLGWTGGTNQPDWLKGTNLTKFDVPGLFETMFSGGDSYWWCKDVNVFAGCLLGGGTAINGLLYWIPPDSDFAVANGWPSSWTNHLPFTNKLRQRIPGTDTPSTDGKRYIVQVYNVMRDLLQPLGYRNQTINNVPNDKDHVFGYSTFSTIGGKRAGPISTYFKTASARPNLTYFPGTTVLNVVRTKGKITGVQTDNPLIGPNGFVPLTTRGRVILSAGSFGSPRILFRSGIGPSDMINLVKGDAKAGPNLPPQSDWINLPVGDNVSDNPSINLVFSHPDVDSYDNWGPIWDKPRAADAAQYIKDQSGPFAHSSPRVNFWRSLSGRDGKTRWLQGTTRPGAAIDVTTFPHPINNIFTITSYLATGVTSRGRIGIDAALTARALKNPWFTDPVDKEVLIAGLKEILGSVKHVQGMKLLIPDNKTTIEQYVDNYETGSLNSNHWVGSNSILKVVDQNVKVMNTDNLFVIDASIIPSMPMGNPQGTIMAMAEQAVAKVLALSGGP